MSKFFVRIKDNNFTSAHVVIIKDEKILILKRSSTDEWMPEHYGLPGGKLESREDILEAVCRECKEETNLIIAPNDLNFLSKVSGDKKHAFFYTTKFSGEPKLDFEHDDFTWVEPKDLSKYKLVPDLPSIIAAALEKLK
jgi:8-oxo-dGTP pyrophosphatase MutT (NUDIX family)